MIGALLKGLKITLWEFFNPPITIRYPEERRELYPRWRGLHHLEWDEVKNREKCVACRLCSTVCPAQCITVVPGENEKHEMYPVEYSIDLLRCIFCGFCVEACPVNAIVMTTKYEMAGESRESMLLTKEMLLKT